jgi:O-antigen ligase
MLAVLLFLIVAGPVFWDRMQSLKHAGEDIEGMDTGGGRLEIIEAQWKMFADYPLGCGAMCTAVLSPGYMAEDLLTGFGETRVRASHNTFMSFLVEQGIVGAVLYLAILIWIAKRLLALARYYKNSEGFLPTFFPALAAILAAITVGDMFVSYTKFEARIWFIAVLMALTSIAHRAQEPMTEGTAKRLPVTTKKPAPALPRTASVESARVDRERAQSP